jgi:aminoglycoside 6'-N-acetyltransferase
VTLRSLAPDDAADQLVDDRGHHRITIDPAAANAAAIRAYERSASGWSASCGATSAMSTGTGWHDGLLMELVV